MAAKGLAFTAALPDVSGVAAPGSSARRGNARP